MEFNFCDDGTLASCWVATSATGVCLRCHESHSKRIEKENTTNSIKRFVSINYKIPKLNNRVMTTLAPWMTFTYSFH
jgi:hypothetical protein